MKLTAKERIVNKMTNQRFLKYGIAAAAAIAACGLEAKVLVEPGQGVELSSPAPQTEFTSATKADPVGKCGMAYNCSGGGGQCGMAYNCSGQ